MEITKVFVNAFGYVLLGKLRRFIRRSVMVYALCSAMAAFGLSLSNRSAAPGFPVARSLLFFGLICFVAFALMLISAVLRSRDIKPQTITFKENELFVDENGRSTARGWDWIIAARETSKDISLLIQRRPRRELFLPKAKLNEAEQKTLTNWLAANGKPGSKNYWA